MSQVILKAYPEHVSLIIGNQKFCVIDAHTAGWSKEKRLPTATTADIIHNILVYGNVPHKVIGQIQNWDYCEKGTGSVSFEDGYLSADTISEEDWENYHIELKEISPVKLLTD